MRNDTDNIASAAAEMGRRGGAARAANMTKEQRSEAARKAAVARWKGKKSRKGQGSAS